jgi:hypothetical protein
MEQVKSPTTFGVQPTFGSLPGTEHVMSPSGQPDMERTDGKEYDSKVPQSHTSQGSMSTNNFNTQMA